MNKLVKPTWLTLALLSICACSPQADGDNLRLALGDAEDYMEFLEERGDIEDPVPFEPEPLSVSAVGKVQAQPDIAVITALITAEDKNESRAVNEMGEIINAVQSALSGRKIETGFTAINSNREFDERCQNDNRFAQRRHRDISQDYYFNKRLDDRGDTETKRRDPKPRVSQKTCFAQKIKVSTNMVIRIQPADAAGDVLRALSDAGAETSRLYGYDFTDYDALYQKAAAKAVRLAREKAQTVARIAGGTLGEIESFSVSPPDRRGRFGPQPNVIRPANRYQGPIGSVIDRRLHDGRGKQNRGYAPPSITAYSQDSFSDEIVVTGRKTSAAQPSAGFVQSPAPSPQAQIQLQTQTQTQTQTYGTLAGANINANTNALSISLLSGPQTVSVTANLGYTYETPLNGKIIIEPDDDS